MTAPDETPVDPALARPPPRRAACVLQVRGRHEAPPAGSAAREATAPPWHGRHRADERWETQDCSDDAPDGRCWDCRASKYEPHRLGCPRDYDERAGRVADERWSDPEDGE